MIFCTCSALPARRWLLALLVAILLGGLTACDYARMKEQEYVRTYEVALPQMPEGTIPVAGGVEITRVADPSTLVNPLPRTPETVERGRAVYDIACLMCHGPRADGNGTVGQSFHPLPTNLRDPKVQTQPDGLIFYRVSFGFERQPPLYYTVAEEDRWAVIHFIRSLAEKANNHTEGSRG